MQNSTLLVTGANRGIGLQLTEQFAADGWNVLACCRNPDGELQALSERHPQVELLALDVTDYAQMATLSTQLHDRPIDILLSNAGIYGPKGVGFGEVDPARLARGAGSQHHRADDAGAGLCRTGCRQPAEAGGDHQQQGRQYCRQQQRWQLPLSQLQDRGQPGGEVPVDRSCRPWYR